MTKLFYGLKRAAQDFIEDDCMSHGASVAYCSIFAIPPLLVLVLFIAGAFGVSDDVIRDVVSQQLGISTAAVQADAAGVKSEKQGASSGQKQPAVAAGDAGAAGADGRADSSQLGSLGIISRIVGIGLLVFSATGLFAQLQYALNRAWEVEPDPQQGGVVRFLLKRVLSLGMIVVIGFLLLVSLVLTTFIDEIVGYVQGDSASTFAQGLAIALNSLGTWLVATVLFAAMYKILPDARMAWRDVWVGAGLTALLLVVGKALIGWYLQSADVGSGWGNAAASMIGMLVWIYYTSLIVLFGAELTQVWANEFGRGVEPADGAVRTVKEKRHVRESAA